MLATYIAESDQALVNIKNPLNFMKLVARLPNKRGVPNKHLILFLEKQNRWKGISCERVVKDVISPVFFFNPRLWLNTLSIRLARGKLTVSNFGLTPRHN